MTTTPTLHCTTMQDGVWKLTATAMWSKCCCCMSNELWQKIPIVSLCVNVRVWHPTPPTDLTLSGRLANVCAYVCVCLAKVQGDVWKRLLNSIGQCQLKEYVSHCIHSHTLRRTHTDCSSCVLTCRYVWQQTHAKQDNPYKEPPSIDVIVSVQQKQVWIERVWERGFLVFFCPFVKNHLHLVSFSLFIHLLTPLSFGFFPFCVLTCNDSYYSPSLQMYLVDNLRSQ